MNISYTTTLPEKGQFFDLFITTGWNEEYKLTPDELYTAVSNRWYTLSAYSDDKLIGVGCVISDGIVHALIVDMIVHPDWKSKNIGSVIMEYLVKKCREHNIYDIQLFSAKGVTPFYKKHNFVCRPDDAPGMEYNHNT